MTSSMHNRLLNMQALIDGPTTGVARQALSFDHMILTNLVVKGLPRNAGQSVVKKFLEKEDVMAKWSKTAWAQKLATRQTRSNLSDFDRFKVAKLKNQVRIGYGIHMCMHEILIHMGVISVALLSTLLLPKLSRLLKFNNIHHLASCNKP